MAFKQDTDAYRAAALKAAADYGSAGLAAYNDAVASAEGQLAGADRFQADAAARGVPQDAAAELGGIMRNSAEFGIAQARRGRASAQNTAAAQTSSVNQYFDMLQASEPFVTAYTQAKTSAQNGGSSAEQDKQILGEARAMRAEADKSAQARADAQKATDLVLSTAEENKKAADAALTEAEQIAKDQMKKQTDFSSYQGQEERLAAAMGLYGKGKQKEELSRRLGEVDDAVPNYNPFFDGIVQFLDGTHLIPAPSSYKPQTMRDSIRDEFKRLPQVKEGDRAEFDRLTKGNRKAAEDRVAASKQSVEKARQDAAAAQAQAQKMRDDYAQRFGRDELISGSTEEQLAREIAKSRYGYSDAKAYASFADKTAAEQATELRGQNYLSQVQSGQVDMQNQADFVQAQAEYIGAQMPEVAMLAKDGGIPSQTAALLVQDPQFSKALSNSMDDATRLLSSGSGGQSIQAFVNQRLSNAMQLDPSDPDYVNPNHAEVISKIIKSRMVGQTPENFTLPKEK